MWADPNGPYRSRQRESGWHPGPKASGADRRMRGYVFVYRPDHPNNKGGYVNRSRITVEAAIGRYLQTWEQVHHINGIKDDDRYPENLVVLTRAEHNHVHKPKTKSESLVGRWDSRGGACRRCERSDRPHRAQGLCGACYEWLRRRGALNAA